MCTIKGNTNAGNEAKKVIGNREDYKQEIKV